MATASISPPACRNWPNRGNPDFRPGLRSGAQQAVDRVRLPRPAVPEERRQPRNGLSRPARRRRSAAGCVATGAAGARCGSTAGAERAGRPLSRLGMVRRAVASQRRDDRPRCLHVSDQPVQRPRPHLVSMARHGILVDRCSAGREQEQAVVARGRGGRSLQSIQHRELTWSGHCLTASSGGSQQNGHANLRAKTSEESGQFSLAAGVRFGKDRFQLAAGSLSTHPQ